MASGRYGNVEDYIAEAIELLHERQECLGESNDELRTSLEAAWHEAERGELTSLEDVREEMKAMKSHWMGDGRRA